MPHIGNAVTVNFTCWDTVNNVGKTGDAANIILRGSRDGVLFTPYAPSITEIDETNMPGVYSASLTASENNGEFLTLGGKSSTSDCVIIPTSWTNELSGLLLTPMQASINAIPTTPLLSNDVRLLNLDGKISSCSTLTAAQVWANEVRTLTAALNSPGVITLLSRIASALSFTGGNVHVHVKAKDNIDFGALEKASLNAATPAVTVSDKTNFSLATPPPTAAQIRTEIDSNSTQLAAIKGVADKLDDTLEDDDGTYRFTEDALAAATTGGGGWGGPSAAEIADAVWDETLTSHLGTGSTGNALAAIISTELPAIQSAIEALDFSSVTEELQNVVEGVKVAFPVYGKIWSYTLTNSATGHPIKDAQVCASTDPGGQNIVQEARTDAFGVARLYLVPGTYYIWRFKPGFNPVNPDVEVVQ